MRTAIRHTFMLLLLAATLQAQDRYGVSGIVRDFETGERLIGANISAKGSTTGTVTDNNGHFVLLLNDPATIEISYIGYQTQTIGVKNQCDTLINISLVPGSLLGEVVVLANPFVRTGLIQISNEILQRTPSLSGKPDVIKALQLKPGVMQQSEASSLMLVRGGNPGENSYLLDQVPLIYVNHLGGFMSVFNPDIINGLELYKANFPARFGGKLSSVLNITQKEGNTTAWKGSVQAGITDFSLVAEGPLNTKTSFILAGRKSLFDVIFLAASGIGDGNNSTFFYGFHDINAKISWKPDAKNSLHLNLFQGDDYMNFYTKKSRENPANKNTLVNVWGNFMASAGWKHLLLPRIYVESHLAYSRYRVRESQLFKYKEEGNINIFQNKFLSSMDVASMNSTWKWQPVLDWKVEFGFNSALSKLLPGHTESTRDNPIVLKQTAVTSETAFFVDNIIDMPANFRTNVGGRLTIFNNKGYTAMLPEPRLELHKRLGVNQQISAGYMRVHQFAHLLFTPGSFMSNEVWIPADDYAIPSRADQFTFGWSADFFAKGLQTELSFYHKKLSNLTTYKEGFSNLMGNTGWHSKIETGGTGTAIGMELSAIKKTGNWNLYAAYTHSKATRHFSEINNGQAFVFDFDRPHAISLLIDHTLNKRMHITAAWVFQSGLPYTPVIGRYLAPGSGPGFELMEVLVYGERNSARMKHYHRLDLSFTLNKLNTQNQVVSSWVFGVYNAYNRKNPVYYYLIDSESIYFFRPNYSGPEQVEPAMYQLSLFPIIPNISYKRNFGVGTDKKNKTLKEKFLNLIYHD
jgi:hypothetical protein